MGRASGRVTVHLTTLRVVLERPPRGGLLSSRVAATVLDVPLRNVTNASLGAVLRRARFVSLETSLGEVRLDVVDPPKWLAAIAAARAGVAHASAAPATVTHTIERHVVKIRCPALRHPLRRAAGPDAPAAAPPSDRTARGRLRAGPGRSGRPSVATPVRPKNYTPTTS